VYNKDKTHQRQVEGNGWYGGTHGERKHTSEWKGGETHGERKQDFERQVQTSS
jgi:hypothetical protein